MITRLYQAVKKNIKDTIDNVIESVIDKAIIPIGASAVVGLGALLYAPSAAAEVKLPLPRYVQTEEMECVQANVDQWQKRLEENRKGLEKLLQGTDSCKEIYIGDSIIACRKRNDLPLPCFGPEGLCRSWGNGLCSTYEDLYGIKVVGDSLGKPSRYIQLVDYEGSYRIGTNSPDDAVKAVTLIRELKQLRTAIVQNKNRAKRYKASEAIIDCALKQEQVDTFSIWDCGLKLSENIHDSSLHLTVMTALLERIAQDKTVWEKLEPRLKAIVRPKIQKRNLEMVHPVSLPLQAADSPVIGIYINEQCYPLTIPQ